MIQGKFAERIGLSIRSTMPCWWADNLEETLENQPTRPSTYCVHKAVDGNLPQKKKDNGPKLSEKAVRG